MSKSQSQMAREGLLKELGPDHERYRRFVTIHDRAMMICDGIMQMTGKPSRRIAIDSKDIKMVDDLLVLQLNQIVAELTEGFRHVITAGEARIIELEEQVKLLQAKLAEVTATKH